MRMMGYIASRALSRVVGRNGDRGEGISRGGDEDVVGVAIVDSSLPGGVRRFIVGEDI